MGMRRVRTAGRPSQVVVAAHGAPPPPWVCTTASCWKDGGGAAVLEGRDCIGGAAHADAGEAGRVVDLETSGSGQRRVPSCGSEDGVAKPGEAAAASP